MENYCIRSTDLTDLLGKTIEEKIQAINRARRSGQIPVPRSLFGCQTVIWTDEDFLKKLKEAKWYLIDELTTSKNIAHNVLRFLLTGKTGGDSSLTVIQQFISALDWFDDGFDSASHVVKDLMLHLQSTPHVYSANASLSKADLVSEFKNRLSPHIVDSSAVFTQGNRPVFLAAVAQQLTRTCNSNLNLGLSTDGLMNISQDEAIKMVEQYYDLIEVYYNSDKRGQAISCEINRSISFVRSLYVLVLMLLRCRAKDPDSVMKCITNGSYLRIARKLVNSPGDVLFSIYPKSAELSGVLNRGQSSEITSIYYILLGIYCGMSEGISNPHVVSTDGEVPQRITNPLQVTGAKRFSSLIDLLKNGCMLQIKYKGMHAIRIIEELSHLTSKSVTDVLNILCTSITVGHCREVYSIFAKYAPRWSKIGDITYYHPAETTWRFSKNFTDYVFPELCAKYNDQFIYRLASILASQKTNQTPRIMSIKNYIVRESDKKYIRDVSEKLFRHCRSNFPEE